MSFELFVSEEDHAVDNCADEDCSADEAEEGSAGVGFVWCVGHGLGAVWVGHRLRRLRRGCVGGGRVGRATDYADYADVGRMGGVMAADYADGAGLRRPQIA